MNSESLSVKNIEGGKLLKAVDRELERLSKDVILRADVEKPRVLVVQISLKPNLRRLSTDSPDKVNEPKIGWNLSTKMPGVYGMELSGFIENGELKINTDFPGSRNRYEQALPEMGSSKKEE